MPVTVLSRVHKGLYNRRIIFINAKTKTMTTIKVTNANQQVREIALQADISLMELLREAGYDEIAAMCGGCCSCATCHVHITQGTAELAPIEEDEEFLLEDADGYNQARSRLSCQVILNDSDAGMQVQLLDNN